MIKLLPFILFQKYIYILALEKANPGNCANCIGTFRSVYSRTKIYAARVSYAAERADGRAAVLSKLLGCSCRCRPTAEPPPASCGRPISAARARAATNHAAESRKSQPILIARSSAVAEEPRDALCQLKPYEMLHKCSLNCI